jgi:uncharacterized protein
MKYQYRKKDSTKTLAVILIIGIVLGSLGSYYYFSYFYSQPQEIQAVQVSNTSRAVINLVAVDDEGNGLSTPLIVELKPGTGQALTNIDKMLFWTDTQESIQTAKSVAENITGINASRYDLTYSIESNATVIGGPSAGAALAIATMAVLTRQNLRDDVVITGTVNPDGTIGQIGGVLEKAQAAKNIGAKLFLVPLGQGEQTYLRPHETCTQKGRFQYCQTTYDQETVNIGKDIGIAVIEVANVSQAYNFFKM